MDKNKTVYIWDLAGTLFADVWNKKRTGFQKKLLAQTNKFHFICQKIYFPLLL